MSFDITLLDKGLKLDQTVTAFSTLVDYPVKHKLLAEVIRCELSNLRTGNAHTKTRANVQGGGKKPWKQKGTGRARHGSTRSPIWVGGGVAWGPKNDVNWHLKINKTARVAALKSILKDRLTNTGVYSLENGYDFPKTKDASVLLDSFSEKTGDKVKKMVIIYDSTEKNNLNGFPNTEVKMINVKNLKIHKLANAHRFIFTPEALKQVSEKIA